MRKLTPTHKSDSHTSDGRAFSNAEMSLAQSEKRLGLTRFEQLVRLSCDALLAARIFKQSIR